MAGKLRPKRVRARVTSAFASVSPYPSAFDGPSSRRTASSGASNMAAKALARFSSGGFSIQKPEVSKRPSSVVMPLSERSRS